MRISKEHKLIIKNVAHKIFGDATIWLFGSRANNNQRGGDIDLLIETKNNVTLEDKIKFLTHLETSGIARKVDVLIKSPNCENLSIFETAKETGVIL